jgi:hypothetical protein
VKAGESIELILGAVIGPINRAESIVAGLYRDGVLVITGRNVPLLTVQSRSLATVLTSAQVDIPSGSSGFGPTPHPTTCHRLPEVRG